jgi:hypothetical protein
MLIVKPMILKREIARHHHENELGEGVQAK